MPMPTTSEPSIQDRLTIKGIKSLTSPSTAEFGGEAPRENIIDHKNGKYTVTGWVDSQNSFGATVRRNFRLKVRYEGNNQWALLEGPPSIDNSHHGSS